MRDPRSRLREELVGLEIAPERLHDLVEELAQDLEERARTARASGASDDEAAATAWAGLGSAEELRARLREVERWTAAQQAERDEALGRPRGGALREDVGRVTQWNICRMVLGVID